MLVFKLSWAPWILIVAGILVAMDDPTGLILTVAGLFWLVLKAKKKKGVTQSGVAPDSTKTDTTKTQQTNTSKAVMNYCPHCGKPIESDFAFCSNCGSKLNIK